VGLWQSPERPDRVKRRNAERCAFYRDRVGLGEDGE